MATQEPNVYAGLSVVIGGLMHARPRFFAKVMGELLFWVGEDKMLFGSDYGIWEPKWQIDGFLEWDYPDPDHEEFADYPRLGDAGKRKILGLNAAKLYGIEVPGRVPAARLRRHSGCAGGRAAPPDGMILSSASCLTLDGVIDPELDEPITTLRFVSACEVTPDGDVEVVLRLPTPQCAPNFAFRMAADARKAVRRLPGVPSVKRQTGGPLHRRRDQRRAQSAARASPARFPVRPMTTTSSPLRELFSAQGAGGAPVDDSRVAAGVRRKCRGGGRQATARAAGRARGAALPRAPGAARDRHRPGRAGVRVRPPASRWPPASFRAGCGWRG